MKKNLVSMLFLICLFTYTAKPAYSIFEVAAEGTYGGYTLKNKDASATETEKEMNFSGPGLSAFAHFTLGIPMVLTIGLGPSVDIAWLTYSGDLKGITTLAAIRAGAEIMLTLDVVPVVSPFVRAGYTYDINAYDMEVPYVNITLPITMTGSSFHVNGGIIYPLVPLVKLVLEGGIVSGSTTTSVEDPTNSVDPAVLGLLDSLNKQEQDHSAWRVGLGIMISI
ncbi:MAG: hypothetical protein OEZ22_02940 [Spirochaetia bacterium]|nr:hypothetical protein [Spirochaetia bacterium]